MWKNDVYIYSKRMLRNIALNYANLYDGLPIPSGQIMDEWALTEYLVDFDRALREIGRGDWDGHLVEFKEYHSFGKLQRIVIADIMGITDEELFRLHFVNLPQLRGSAYYLMAINLNGL